MVYITNYNLSLLQNLFAGKDYSNINMNEEILKIDRKWFNRGEIANILTAKKLYLAPEELMQTIKKLTIKENERMLNPKSIPAYHLDSHCKKLHSDFEDYKLPEGLKTEDKEEFRTFFKSLLNLDEKTTPHKLKIKMYQQKYPDLPYPESIIHENSGVAALKNRNLKEIEFNLDKLIEEANIFYKMHRETLYRLETRSFKYNDINFIKEIGERAASILGKFHNQKEAIKNEIIEYYKLSNAMNGKIDASKRVLSLAGFVPCSRCAKN